MPIKPTLVALLLALTPIAGPATEDTEDAWFDADLEARVAAVNEGDLVFLSEAPADPVHHHHNRMTLDRGSLRDGWVAMTQCHRHLDAVPRAQIVYHEDRIRDLAVLSFEDIDAVWVEANSVQLTNVRPGASLCVSARTRALEANADGSYTLRSGPFMRRFLDGYYPMRVSMDIEIADGDLRLLGTEPRRQAGFEVEETGSGVRLDALFEGRLKTSVHIETDLCQTASC
jgi:hypothetical protein